MGSELILNYFVIESFMKSFKWGQLWDRVLCCTPKLQWFPVPLQLPNVKLPLQCCPHHGIPTRTTDICPLPTSCPCFHIFPPPLPYGLSMGCHFQGTEISSRCFGWVPDLLLPEKPAHWRLQGLEIKYFLCYPVGMIKPLSSIALKSRTSVMCRKSTL